MYNEKVLQHFQNPRNNAEMKDADAMGLAVSAVCGDVVKLFLKIDKGVIHKAAFKTTGCAAAIASGSIMTEIVKNKTLEEAGAITRETISDALGALPAIKMHCPELAVEALHNALKDYEKHANHHHAHSKKH